jgi:hypothetical protein
MFDKNNKVEEVLGVKNYNSSGVPLSCECHLSYIVFGFGSSRIFHS